MGQRVSDTTRVAAPADVIFDVITDLPSYPEWTDGVEEVEVLSTDDEGRPRTARFRVDARVVEVTYTLVYEYEDMRMSWSLVEGDMISQLDGAYELTDLGDEIEVRYTIEADVDMPLPGFMKKRAAKQILDQGLRGLRQRAEALS